MDFKTKTKRFLWVSVLFFSLPTALKAQDLWVPEGINTSDPNNRNINHADGKALQDLKRSSGFLIIIKTGNQGAQSTGRSCSCNVVNTVGQNAKLYITTAAHCVEGFGIGTEHPAYFSFDYEMPNNERGDKDADKSISGVYGSKYKVLFSDQRSDLALLELVPQSYKPQLLEYAYATGWDNSIQNDGIYSNISHPLSDHKKVFIRPNISFLKYQILTVENQKHIGFFYINTNQWNNIRTDLESGCSGSGLFTSKNRLTAVHSYGTDFRSSHSAIFNRWWGTTKASVFSTYLDATNTWLNQIPGGYINDLVPNSGVFKLELEPNLPKVTPSTSSTSPTALADNVLMAKPSILFKPDRAFYLEPLPFPDVEEFYDIQGINAEIPPGADVILSVYYLDKDTTTGQYKERLIYGVQANNTTTANAPRAFGFKGKPWNCDSPNYPPCNRFPIDRFLRSSTTGMSNVIKSDYLQAFRSQNINNNTLNFLTEAQIPIKIRLENIGTIPADINAISYPGDVPRNALQLFSPEAVESRFKSYKYKPSFGQDAQGLYISDITVELDQYVLRSDGQCTSFGKRTLNGITTDNNGGYLNLVNPNFLIDGVVASEDDLKCPKNELTLSFKTSTITNKHYGAWLDYYKDRKGAGNTNPTDDYTYNFVNDTQRHNIEQLGLGNTSEEIVIITHEIPRQSELPFNGANEIKTRLRIAVAGLPQSPNPTLKPDGVYAQGEVEDYLVKIRPTSAQDKALSRYAEVFDKISMAEGSAAGEDVAPPQGEDGVSIGFGTDDAPVANLLPYLYDPSSINNLNMGAFLTTARDIVQVGYNAIIFDGLAHISVGGAVGGGSEGNFMYQPYSKHTSTYDLIPDLVCVDLIADGTCDQNRRRTNTNTNYQIVYEEGGGSNGLSLRFNGTNIQYGVKINNQLQVIDYPYNLVPNQYMNLTIVFNEGIMELYKNGVKVATNNAFSTRGITTIPEHLDHAGLAGISGTGTIWADDTQNVNFHGVIDYFGYTNKVLTATEIAALTTPRPVTPNSNKTKAITENSDLPLQTKGEPKAADFSIFPNPAKEELNILIEVENAGPVSINIFDLSGRKIYEMNKPNISKGHQLITLKNLKVASGEYILKIQAGNVTRSGKVIFK